VGDIYRRIQDAAIAEKPKTKAQLCILDTVTYHSLVKPADSFEDITTKGNKAATEKRDGMGFRSLIAKVFPL
jgi:hypothetical protein